MSVHSITEECPEICPWCDGELEEGCCDSCDDQYAANDNEEAA